MVDKKIEALNINKTDLDRFAGKHIAIFRKKVIGWGNTVTEAFKMAKEKMPRLRSEQILLRFVPQEGFLILHETFNLQISQRNNPR